MKSTLNAMYSACTINPWSKIIKVLDDEQLICPKYLIAWRNDVLKYREVLGENTYIQKVEDAWKGTGFPNGIHANGIDEDIYKRISYYILIGIRMMDRLDPLGDGFKFRDREDFFLELIGYWISIIDKYSIDIVISPSIPHRVFDYALYVAASIVRKKQYISMQQTPFGSNIIIVQDIDVIPNLDIESKHSININDIEARINQIRGDYQSGKPDYMKVHHKQNKFYTLHVFNKYLAKLKRLADKKMTDMVYANTYWVNGGVLPSESKITWLGYAIRNMWLVCRLKALAGTYRKHTQPINESAFIFVALHYQPEETTVPSGGFFGNQMQLLRFLVTALPDNLQIIVKEHKAQFYPTQEGAAGRDQNFYRKARSISNRIKFVDVDMDPYKLIDKALAVVTVTGTIGWESVVRGTPALVFGRTWYENMPGVWRIRTFEDVFSNWNDITSWNLDTTILLDYHKKLAQQFILAKHYKSYEKNTDIDFDDSARNIILAIKKAL